MHRKYDDSFAMSNKTQNENELKRLVAYGRSDLIKTMAWRLSPVSMCQSKTTASLTSRHQPNTLTTVIIRGYVPTWRAMSSITVWRTKWSSKSKSICSRKAKMARGLVLESSELMATPSCILDLAHQRCWTHRRQVEAGRSRGDHPCQECGNLFRSVIEDWLTQQKGQLTYVFKGHHVEANHVTFPKQEQYKHHLIHSEKYKNATHNNIKNQNVLVVGIGNSAVDTAVNLVDLGANRVTISTRSGAWIYPNYMFGLPTDQFASRAFLKWVPTGFANWFTELVVKQLQGDPTWWGLNPKNRILSSQPTVSPTLIHHIQRGNIKIRQNISSFTENGVIFKDGQKDNFDSVIMCTGFKVDCPFLAKDLKSAAFGNSKSKNSVNLYKQVFLPRPDFLFKKFIFRHLLYIRFWYISVTELFRHQFKHFTRMTLEIRKPLLKRWQFTCVYRLRPARTEVIYIKPSFVVFKMI